MTKTFGGTRAVDDLSFTAKTGEVLGLLGPNGAGKTTTMRLMTGFLFPDAGEVTVGNIPLFTRTTEAQRMIGYLPEGNPLYRDMLVCDFLKFAAGMYRLDESARAQALEFSVASVGIGDVYTRPIGTLSKGYRQRVGIAAALVHNPKVLILDEPTEGLDPNQRTDLRSLIKKLAEGRTIVVSTHVMQEAQAMCDRILIIHKGKLVADGSPHELSRAAQGKRVLIVECEGKDCEKQMKKLEGVEEASCDTQRGDRVRCTLTSAVDADLRPAVSALAHEHQWTIWYLAEQERRLEDIFQALTV